MKKSLTKLLIIAIICAIATYILCKTSLEIKYTNTDKVKEEFNEMGNDSPGAGEYLIVAGGTALIADFAINFASVIILGIPILTNFIIVFSQIIARLFQIGLEKKWKDITSKVFTIISIVLQILLFIYILFIFDLIRNKILLALVLALNVISVIIFIKELVKNKSSNKIEIIENK